MGRRSGSTPPRQVAVTNTRPGEGYDAIGDPGARSRPVGQRQPERRGSMRHVDPHAHREHFWARRDSGQTRLCHLTRTEHPGDHRALRVDLQPVDRAEGRRGGGEQNTTPDGSPDLNCPVLHENAFR